MFEKHGTPSLPRKTGMKLEISWKTKVIVKVTKSQSKASIMKEMECRDREKKEEQL